MALDFVEAAIESFLACTDYSATSVRTMKNGVGQVGFAPHNLILASEDFSDSNWTKTNTTVTPNAAAAPDGTTTADKISHTSATAALTQGSSNSNDRWTVLALFAKYIDHQWLRIYHADDGDNGSTWIDLQNQVLGTDQSSQGATLTVLNDGWLMIEIPVFVTGASVPFNMYLSDADASGTETSGTSAYIWGAHLYENGLAGMFDVPEDQRALASLTKYLPNKAVVTGPNLVSNGTFDSNTNGWTDKSTGTGTATVNGSNQLELYRLDSSNVGYVQQGISVAIGSHYRVSLDEITDGGALYLGTSDGGTQYYNAAAQGGVNHVYITATASTLYLGVRGSTNGSTSNYDNITVEEVDRDPTAARFLPRRGNHEYIDGAWVKGLKAESEARTNLVADALDFSQWSANNSSPVEDETGLDNTTSAFTLIDNSATGTNQAHVAQNVTLGSGVDTCFSVYAKADQLDWLFMNVNGIDADVWCYFDLTSGSVGTSSNNTTNGIEDVGGGWFRCYMVGNTTTDTSGTFRIYVAEADNDSVVDLDGTSSIIIWGAQAEAGSTPSSLIPTYGATRTRTAETFTQKSDKIIWPNTTYVDGTELVTNGTFDSDTDWTKGTGWTIGSGVASGSNGNASAISQAETLTDRSVYEITFTISGRTAGEIAFKFASGSGLGADVISTDLVGENDTYTRVLVADGTSSWMGFTQNSAFDGSIDNISVKEINPRALAVVMHGYVTYADGNDSNQVTFIRYQQDGDNRFLIRLRTDAGTGAFEVYQETNATVDKSKTADDDFYSPGANVPFKWAGRFLDNAVQGAADGTATTENTTPVGLPDLSATQTEWFYDFMGHITLVGMTYEHSADALDSTNGPTTLIDITGDSYHG